MSRCLRSLRKSWKGLCLLRYCGRSKSFGEGIWSRTPFRRMKRRKRRRTKKRRRSRASLLISVHVFGAVSCSLEALARMDGSAHSHTMSLSSIQTHGSAMWCWLAGIWVLGLGIPWTLPGCLCRFSRAGKIYWGHGVRGLASPDPLVGAIQSLEVDGVRDGPLLCMSYSSC